MGFYLILLSDLFLDRLQSQEEIVKEIEYSLKGAEKIDLTQLKEISQKVSSTIFLCVIINCLKALIALSVDSITVSYLFRLRIFLQ